MTWRVLLLLSLSVSAFAGDPPAVHLSRFGDGGGPQREAGTIHLLDAARTPSQSNAAAFDREREGAFETLTLRCHLRVDEGGDGGSFLFLNTEEFGARGPAPFLKSCVEPNLARTFAVGVDVHDPPNSEPFGPWGNVLGRPEREVSLHWDGREIVKRVAPEEFRGDTVPVVIELVHVPGGAEVTVKIGAGTVYDHYFVAALLPYESRLAIAAGTRADATTVFDVSDIALAVGETAAKRRPPLHIEVFHHVMTDNSKTAYQAQVELPPLDWAFARIILTLDIHDGGKMWDEWDRNGYVSVWDAAGEKRDIVPFITSYRTPCHWQVDVTHFRPYLAGTTKFEVLAGTTFYKNRGYAMSVALDYYHGESELEPFAVAPVWHVNGRHGSAENHFQDAFPAREIAIPAEASAARLFTTTTGHSQVGEFTPSDRAVIFAPKASADPPAEHRFANRLWKEDCYLNPNRPQFGTWKYPRAGWAPGDVVRPWWVDLTPYIVPGETARLRYETQAYDFGDAAERPPEEQIEQALHAVRSYLILYRESRGSVPAPIVRVTGVQDGSNAAKAGIRAGDYLATYDGRRLDSVEDLRAALRAAVEAGAEKIAVILYRGSERIELEMPTGQMGVRLSAQ